MPENLIDLAESALADRKTRERERRKAGYHRRRSELIAFLGGKCKGCGEMAPDKLEFHHLEERTWQARKTSRWVRVACYWREARAGIIELLCGKCNKEAGRPWLKRDEEWIDEIEGSNDESVPF